MLYHYLAVTSSKDQVHLDLGFVFEVFCQKLMKSVDSHGSSSLLFVLKVMVSNFVSKDSHKVRIALIVMLPFELLWR